MTFIKSIKNITLITFMLLTISLNAESPNTEAYLTGSKLGDRLTGDLGMFGGSFASVGFHFLGMGLLASDEDLSVSDQIISSSFTELSNISLFLSGSPDALFLSLGGIGLWGSEAIVNSLTGISSEPAKNLYWAGNNLAMYKSYDSYASYRLRSGAWDNSIFKRHSFYELMKSPFDGSNIMKPQVLLGAASGIIAITSLMLIEGQDLFMDSVLKTGDFYRGDRNLNAPSFYFETISMSALSATYTAVGEEAVYSGFMYEELCDFMGKKWGSFTKTATFTSMHIISDIARGESWKYIVCHSALVAGTDFLSNWAYDEECLPLAVAVHTWSDFTAFITTSILTGGVKQK